MLERSISASFSYYLGTIQWFDTKKITPRWEFGLGLSYTTFEFGDLSIKETFEVDSTSIAPTAEPFAKFGTGDSLYDILYTVRT